MPIATVEKMTPALKILYTTSNIYDLLSNAFSSPPSIHFIPIVLHLGVKVEVVTNMPLKAMGEDAAAAAKASSIPFNGYVVEFEDGFEFGHIREGDRLVGIVFTLNVATKDKTINNIYF